MPDKDVCRPFREDDFSRLCEIHDLARRRELQLAGLEAAFVPLSEASHLEGLYDYEIAILERGSEVLGFVGYKNDEIGWLYVSPSHYRQGVGAALMRHALSHAGSEVLVEVLKGNEPALKLYRSFGFEVTAKASGAMPGNEAFTVEVYQLARWGKK